MASSYLLRSMHTTLQIIKCDPNGEVSRRRSRDEKTKKTEAGIRRSAGADDSCWKVYEEV